MEKAGEAMQAIHGKLNIDKVDETMYVLSIEFMMLGFKLLTLRAQGKTPRTTCAR